VSISSVAGLDRLQRGWTPKPRWFASVTFAGLAAASLVACSPYIYKSEVADFGAGVKAVAAAYDDGMAAYAQERSDRQQVDWRLERAKLAKTPGCDIGVGPGATIKDPCELRAAGPGTPLPPGPPSTLERAGPELVAPLQRYAAALVAITDAQDREQLIAAQARLQESVDGFVKATGVPALPLDPLSAIARGYLDQSRYDVLKRSVIAADPQIPKIGAALGVALDTLRGMRADELNGALEARTRTLSPGLSQDVYDARLDGALQGRQALEALRKSDPPQAADKMVKAHRALAEALQDNRRQIASVTAAAREFYDAAVALQKAFATAGAA
jgi:hypothetical protein